MENIVASEPIRIRIHGLTYKQYVTLRLWCDEAKMHYQYWHGGFIEFFDPADAIIFSSRWIAAIKDHTVPKAASPHPSDYPLNEKPVSDDDCLEGPQNVV